jgi:ATP-dependent helicase YprA (DUF1998 family)
MLSEEQRTLIEQKRQRALAKRRAADTTAPSAHPPAAWSSSASSSSSSNTRNGEKGSAGGEAHGHNSESMGSDPRFQVAATALGHDSFRLWQENSLSAWLQGRDSLILSGTGSGKSVCFQVPLLCLCVYVCVYVCICVRLYFSVRCVCMYVCMYVYMCICM